MSPDIKPLMAIERARVAYELMMQRQQESLRLRLARERSRAVKVTTILGCSLALLLGAAIYNDWLPTTMLRSIAISRKVDDGKFVETRTGQVRSFIKGNTCQELQFSNDRGVYVGGSLVPCVVEVERDPTPAFKGSRVNSIRNSFTSR